MQETPTGMRWNSDELHTAVARLCKTMPGYEDALKKSAAAAAQLQELVGFDLSDQLIDQLTYTATYEAHAYYLLGLSQRQEPAREPEL
ncbi:MAG: hypothetical protein HFF39_04925 [Lawsonibacter sp.]|nr:hypothetical protein [Lawsonibacter sp.]